MKLRERFPYTNTNMRMANQYQINPHKRMHNTENEASMTLICLFFHKQKNNISKTIITEAAFSKETLTQWRRK